ncbi:MAG: hypothetical protein PVH91_00395 [Pseudomonadales bacterium]|jgi:hypothetical protein
MSGTNEHDDREKDDEERVLALVRSATARLDPDVGGRLSAMRREVVRQVDAQGSRGIIPSRWMTPSAVAGAAAALCLVLVALLSVDEPPDGQDEYATLAVVSAQEATVLEEMDLLEDLEFLAWLEEDAPDAG